MLNMTAIVTSHGTVDHYSGGVENHRSERLCYSSHRRSLVFMDGEDGI